MMLSLVAALAGEPVRRFALGCRQRYRHQRLKVADCPVLVGGNQKSGTTAIGALLARATGSSFSNDPFWAITRHGRQAPVFPDVLAGRQDLGDVVERHREYFSADVIKDPNFSFLQGQLKRRFPDAPRVFIVRDPRQNIRSILNRLRLDGHLTAFGPEQEAALARMPGWRAILAGTDLGVTGIDHIERLARRWNRAVEGYLAHAEGGCLVRYEDFVADKAGQIGELADRLGMAVTTDIRPEQDRAFQPRGNRRVAPEEFFGERNLARIETICGPYMVRFGYAPRAVAPAR